MIRNLSRTGCGIRHISQISQKRGLSSQITSELDRVPTTDEKATQASSATERLAHRTSGQFTLRQALFRTEGAELEIQDSRLPIVAPDRINWTVALRHSLAPSQLKVQRFVHLSELLIAQQSRSKDAAPLATFAAAANWHEFPLGEKKQVLRMYNSFLQRQLQSSYLIQQDDIAFGIFLAISAGSSEALRHYIELMSSLGLGIDDYWTGRILDVAIGRRESQNHLSDTFFSEQVGGLLIILAPKLFSFVHESTVATHVPRRRYIESVGQLSGPEGILRLWNSLFAENSGDMDSKPLNSVLSSKSFGTLNAVLQELISHGTPRLAWKLLASISWDAKNIERKTMSALLDYPKEMTVWRPGMEAVVLKEYERRLAKIEERFGVRWTGGEGGKHVVVDNEEIQILENNEIL